MISGHPEDKQLFSYDHLSGEWTTWTFVWAVYTTPTGLDNMYPLVDNLGNVYLVDVPAPSGGAFISYAGVLVDLLVDVPIHNYKQDAHSLDRKFVVFEDIFTGVDFGVYRYGVNIFERDVTIDHATVTSFDDFSMSPNGRFIAITCFDMVTVDDDLVLLYEGS